MKLTELDSLSTDELLEFHEEVASKLAATLIAKKKVLEERLRLLKPQPQFDENSIQ